MVAAVWARTLGMTASETTTPPAFANSRRGEVCFRRDAAAGAVTDCPDGTSPIRLMGRRIGR
jgi:hypothetical protein